MKNLYYQVRGILKELWKRLTESHEEKIFRQARQEWLDSKDKKIY